MIKSAATFRTFGQRISAMIVKRFPNIPTIIMQIVADAANVSRVRENLQDSFIDFEFHSINERCLPTEFICLVFDCNEIFGQRVVGRCYNLLHSSLTEYRSSVATSVPTHFGINKIHSTAMENRVSLLEKLPKIYF